jgi:DNA gyrase subunit A
MSVREDDELVCVKLCVPGDNIMIATKSGWAVRFPEDELRPIGRTAMGVKGVRLRDDKDRVSDLVVASADTNILSITKRGYGKMSKMDLYRLTHRGGKGVINIKLREETDEVIATKAVIQEMNLLLASKSGNLIRVRTEDIRQTGRAAKGVIVMRLEEDDEITSVALCEPSEEEDESTLSKPESLDNGDDEPEEEVTDDAQDDQDDEDNFSTEK